jgi:hypothetical protein
MFWPILPTIVHGRLMGVEGILQVCKPLREWGGHFRREPGVDAMNRVKPSRNRATRIAAALCIFAWPVAAICMAQDAVDAGDEPDAQPQAVAPKLSPPEGATQLSPKYDVWVDAAKGVVIVDGRIALRRGMLEMFSCTRNTKEHESIVAADAQAFLVHAGLLRLGAEVGHPVQFMNAANEPEFKPPAGTEIDIEVMWHDAGGKEHTARAQDWIRDMKTGKAMTYPWVFAGSRFWTDPDTGRQYYQAEGGDFICVANFGTAMLDIPVKSSQSNDELEFEAFTDRIPPVGTPVRMFLKPKLEKKETKAEEPQKKANGDTPK